MYCIYNYCVCCKYNYCVCSIYNYCVCCKYNFFVCSTYNFCVCCKYNYSVCFFPCASSCTVFCLYRHPFCKVCHLYRWMPVVYIYLSARTVYRSTICTVVWLYSGKSSVFCMYSHPFCTGRRLYSLLFVHLDAHTVICLYVQCIHPFV